MSRVFGFLSRYGWCRFSSWHSQADRSSGVRHFWLQLEVEGRNEKLGRASKKKKLNSQEF
jgi:hypothetical protein